MIKHLISLLFLLFSSVFLFAQVEAPAYKTAADKFERFYNATQYDSIFQLFTPAMKQALPYEKTVSFLSNLKAAAGSILQRKFTGYKQSYAIYTSNFEKIVYNLSLSVDENEKINGLFVTLPQATTPTPARNETKLQLPFKGTWTVFWGGDTKELNYHVKDQAQKNAFDILITGPDKKTYKTDGRTNEDYYAFGQEIIAPCDGEVVLAVNGVKDNTPGIMNPFHAGGNTVVLKTMANEYLVFCHFKQNSIVVKQGQKIKQSQLLGLCGNSGNSSEPHLHFHIQNMESFSEATDMKSYFDKIIVNNESKTDYSPVKNDLIKNQ